MNCAHCHKKIRELPFICKFCGKEFCSAHRLPEEHKCGGLEKWKKENKEMWFGTKEKYKRKRKIQKRFTPKVYKSKLSLSSKIKKYFWKNKRKIKKFITWVIIILVIFLLFQYYQNNEEDIKNYINQLSSSITNFEINPQKTIEHTGAINKSYVLKSTRLNKIELTLHKSVYDYFKDNAPHEYSYHSYSSYSDSPENWEVEYWSMFLTNSNDEYVIEEIIHQITNATNDEGDIAVRTITRFVQGIPYDWNSYWNITGNVKYPYETLYLNKGVCGEKSLLLAKLLIRLDYGVALFNYKNESHMAVGIKCPYEKSNFNSGYCFIESTDYYVIGKIPGNYVESVNIRKAIPQIIILHEGKTYSP